MGIPPHIGKNRGYYARRKMINEKMELQWRSGRAGDRKDKFLRPEGLSYRIG
jgi:hypothetical protein